MGVGVLEFWDLTPDELHTVLHARLEHERYRQRREAWQAWHTAAVMRAKRLPPLARLFPAAPAKRLTPEEKAEKAREFKDLTDSVKDKLAGIKPGRRRGSGSRK